jgi:VanZ family protein
MTTVFGLPAHALLVHAVVVLAPLTAALEILCALWPAARRRLAWLVLAFATGVMVLAPLTASAGKWLYAQSTEHSPILELHEERGEWAKYFALGLLVVAILQVVQHVRESRSEEPKKALAIGVAVLAIVVGVWATVGIVLIGDSGAQAVWGLRQ